MASRTADTCSYLENLDSDTAAPTRPQRDEPSWATPPGGLKDRMDSWTEPPWAGGGRIVKAFSQAVSVVTEEGP